MKLNTGSKKTIIEKHLGGIRSLIKFSNNKATKIGSDELISTPFSASCKWNFMLTS